MHAIHEYSKMHWDVYLEFRPSNVTLFMNETTPTFVPKVPFFAPTKREVIFDEMRVQKCMNKPLMF